MTTDMTLQALKDEFAHVAQRVAEFAKSQGINLNAVIGEERVTLERRSLERTPSEALYSLQLTFRKHGALAGNITLGFYAKDGSFEEHQIAAIAQPNNDQFTQAEIDNITRNLISRAPLVTKFSEKEFQHICMRVSNRPLLFDPQPQP